MQKYKVLKGGWTVKAVNPYLPVNGESWSDFDRSNPILPLIHQQDEGIKVEGELVWQINNSFDKWDECSKKRVQYIVDNKTMINGWWYKCRQALQPITTNSNEEPQLSQEELKELAKKFEHIPKEMMDEILYDEPLPIASASIENPLNMVEAFENGLKEGKYFVTDMLKSAALDVFMAGFQFGIESQTTQQPLIELLEKRIEELNIDKSKIKSGDHIGYSIDINSRIDELETLLTKINK